MEKKSIKISNLSKMYRIYPKRYYRILDQFNLPYFGKNETGKRYEEFWALKNINLEIKKGERLGIIGKNGAGKSTLLKIICSRIEASEGNLDVNGKVHALLELGTGFYPEFTGRENIYTALYYNGYSEKEIDEMVEEIVDFAELWEFIDTPVRTYSSGMYARLAFAVATSIEPDILVIDEVFGAGDASFIGKCTTRMKKLTDGNNCTIIFVTHALSLMERFCSRAILLHKGRIIDEGTPLDVSKNYSTMVRAEEEINLLTDRASLRKKSLRVDLTSKRAGKEYLFRLIVENGSPEYEHKVEKMMLFSKKEELIIEVGEEYSSNIHEDSRIIFDRGYQNWSEIFIENGRKLRSFKDENGKYFHAPFIFTVDNEYEKEEKNLKITGNFNSNEEVIVQQFSKEDYITIGKIIGNNEFSEYEFKVLRIEENKKEEKIAINSTYGSGEVSITGVELFDCNGEKRRIFKSGESLEAEILMETSKRIEEFVLVFCIYNVDTTPATQLFFKKEDLGIDYIESGIKFNILLSPLMLGRGEYIVSIGLYKYCDMGEEKENPAWVVLDRAIKFKIEQKDGIRKELGRFIHPAKCIVNKK